MNSKPLLFGKKKKKKSLVSVKVMETARVLSVKCSARLGFQKKKSTYSQTILAKNALQKLVYRGHMQIRKCSMVIQK